MTYGRPSMVSPTTARSMVLPSIIDDEYLSTDPEHPGSQPEGVPCQMAFYVHALKLQEILGQMLAALYSGTPDHSTDSSKTAGGSRPASNGAASTLSEKIIVGDFQSVLMLDASLTKWHRELPKQLKIDKTRPGGASEGFVVTPEDTYGVVTAPILVRQANVLQARYFIPYSQYKSSGPNSLLTDIGTSTCASSYSDHYCLLF